MTGSTATDLDVFERYLQQLARAYSGGGTEHSGRSALEALLNAFAGDTIRVQHEPKQDERYGAPDFKATRDGMVLGYVEAKALSTNIDQVLKSEQIQRYRQLSDNLLVTDYLHFAWIEGDTVHRATLGYESDLEAGGVPRQALAAETGALLKGFFSTAPLGISHADELALALARRCRLLRDNVARELLKQQREQTGGRLLALHQAFQDQVFHALELREFADAFAQTLGYGLFLAKFNAEAEVVDLYNVERYIPRNFDLIRELVDFLKELDETRYVDVRWLVEEVLSLINGLNLPTLKDDLSFRHRKVRRGVKARNEDEARLFERDPYIYFYEDFLAAYDAEARESRGVYYTPPPVVNFIIRAVDDVLRESFGIHQGLADHRGVTVLDFAAGTGTFLLEIFERVFQNAGGPGSGKADRLVREHLLKNVYGFEYLIAPYTIAHLKLSQYLQQHGHPLRDAERLEVFLTNTLEPIEPQQNMFLPALTAEAAAAQSVKQKPVLVITGNPPYSGHSRNDGRWITTLIREYTKDFPELQKPAQGKWLQDDYVKFIRFAQNKMEEVDEGIVAIITNHSFLDNPTFRGMRKSLMKTFDRIHVLDLHGSAKRKERTPDGSKDENVFDIQQGVAISIFVKKSDLLDKGVFHADLWGTRLRKYKATAQLTLGEIEWARLDPVAPYYAFEPFDADLWETYRKFPSVVEIFSRNGDPAPGFVTTHDQFAISWSRSEAIEKVNTLLTTESEKEARQRFRLCSQNQWNYETAKKELPKTDVVNQTALVSYRPFDARWSIWNRHVCVHRRQRVMQHFCRKNVALTTCRQVTSAWQHVFVSSLPVDDSFISNKSKERTYVVPLYLYSEEGGVSVRDRGLFDDDIFQGQPWVENIDPEFRALIDERYGERFSPEQVFGYIYAILHARRYRETYAEFLKLDFPRIPMCSEADDFRNLSQMGWELVRAHLLQAIPERGLAQMRGPGDNIVEKPQHEAKTERLWINRTQYFEPVPLDVWEFRLGGYQVLLKYLKDRKGRSLTLDEMTNVESIVNVLSFTIEQMEKIDDLYKLVFERKS